MTERADWVPEHVDVEIPSAARIYDFLLGGAHNFSADRIVGKKILEVLPNGRQVASSNRAFLTRAVRYMLDQGITQFLDLGSGIPTVGNVHDIAQSINPASRIVYVDYDQVAVAHSELILAGNERATVVEADLTEPGEVLGEPAVREFLDFDRPIGLLLVAVFHFVPDDKNPAEIVAKYLSVLPPGSLVALSHLTADQFPGEMAAIVEEMKHSRDPMYFRSYDEVVTLFEGLEVIEPGIVDAPLWRADGIEPGLQEGVYVGVGRKP
jgi:SAM-dependent methyltransferase